MGSIHPDKANDEDAFHFEHHFTTREEAQFAIGRIMEDFEFAHSGHLDWFTPSIADLDNLMPSDQTEYPAGMVDNLAAAAVAALTGPILTYLWRDDETKTWTVDIMFSTEDDNYIHLEAFTSRAFVHALHWAEERVNELLDGGPEAVEALIATNNIEIAQLEADK